MQYSRPLLYSYYHSSCSWRVRIALVHKGIEYDLKTINLLTQEQRSPDFLKVNPVGQIPALVINGKVHADSIAIIEYLEEAYPQKPLMPKDLLERAKVRQICQIITAGIQPLQAPSVASKYSEDKAKQTEWIHGFIDKGFIGLEKVLKECAGKYCVGDELSLADLCLVPQVYNAAMRFGFDMKPFPLISKIFNTLLEVDSIKSTHPNTQPGYPSKI